MKRVLFIDDDQAVLDGLRRTLRSRRSEWDMTFVPVPADALQILSSESVDVVISDMRMPGMDGARFLAQVQKLSPRTVRLWHDRLRVRGRTGNDVRRKVATLGRDIG